MAGWILLFVVLGCFLAITVRHLLGHSVPADREQPSDVPETTGRFAVSVRTTGRYNDKSTRFRVDGPIFPGGGFAPRSLGRQMLKALAARRADVKSGDLAFDREVAVYGDPIEVAAALDVRTRRAILAVIEEGGIIDGHFAEIDVPGTVSDGRERGRVCRLLTEAAEALAPAEPEPVPDRLARKAVDDPEAGVRLRALSHLIEDFPDEGVTGRTCEALSESPDPGPLALVATLGLGARGSGRMRALAAALSPSDLLPTVRAVRRWSGARREAAARMLLDGLEPAEGTALSTSLETLSDWQVVVPLEILLPAARSPHREVRLQAARCLRQVPPDEAVEAALLGLLDPAHETIAVEAVDALHRAGSVRAVEPLLGLAKGEAGSSDLRHAAAAAVVAIQGRLGDVGAGGLALVEADHHAGGLALAAEEGVAVEDEVATSSRDRLSD